MNRVILIGRLTRDPELRYTNNNTPVATFTLAVDRQRSQQDNNNGNMNGNNNNNNDADFIRVTVWNRQAETVKNYLSKGRQVAVEGSIRTGSYDGQNGQRVYTTDVVANRVEFLGSRNDNVSGYNYNEPFSNNTNNNQSGSVNTNSQNVTPYDFGDNNSNNNATPSTGATTDSNPFADFGANIEINDNDLPF